MNNNIKSLKIRPLLNKRSFKLLLFLLFLDLLVFFGTFSLNGVFRPDYLFMILYFSFFLYLFLTSRTKDMVYLALASLFSFVWILFANDQYGYNQDIFRIFGLSAFPLFAWACGLAAIYLVFRDVNKLVNGDNSFTEQFLLFSILYFVFLITLETVAYHIFDIRNLATGNYPGLPFCDCVHAPLWMQVSYFIIGPLFFIFSWYLRKYQTYVLKSK